MNEKIMLRVTSRFIRKVIFTALLPLLLTGTIKTVAQNDIALINVANVTDGGELELDGANSVATAEVDGATYLFVVGTDDNGLSVFSVDDNGLLVSVVDVRDDGGGGAPNLDGPTSVTTAVVADTAYLFVAAGFTDDGVSVFRVADDGLLTNVENVMDGDDDGDGGTLNLDYPTSITTAEITDTTYLFVAAFNDNGVSVFRVGNTGMLTNVENVTYSSDALSLGNVISVTTAVAGGTTYLFVARVRGGVGVFRVGNNGTLTNQGNINVTARSVTTAVVGGTTFLFVMSTIQRPPARQGDPPTTTDGVSVFSIANNGTIANRGTVFDNGIRALDGANSATTTVVDGTPFLFVTGYTDDGVSVFSIGNNGALNNMNNVTDNGDLELDGARSVTTAEVGGRIFLFVAGEIDDGVSVFRAEIPAPPTFGGGMASDQTFLSSCPVSVELPEATSGNGALTHTLTPQIPGLTLNPATGVLSGTPTTPSAAVLHTYTVTDQDEDMSPEDIASLTFMVTVNEDTEAPVPDPLYPFTPLTGECIVDRPTAPTATDNCVGVTGITDAIFPITTNQAITWTFTDGAGNMTTQDQQVTITGDMTGPEPDVGSLPELTGTCNVTPTAPIATDNCDTGIITGIPNVTFPVTTNSTIIWTFTDDAGNETEQTQDIVVDITAPAPNLGSLPELTGACNVTPIAPMATDICAGVITGITDAVFPITATSTITWTYEDNEGNMDTQDQQVTITDVIAPAPDLGSLPELTVACNVTPTAPMATDICAGVITGITDAVFPITATSTITWMFTDDAGNVAMQTQEVTIADIVGPEPDENSLPTLTGECSVTAPLAPPTAMDDDCDTGSITGTTDAFPVTSTSTIIWTFTDRAGNETEQTQDVVINDVTGPEPDVGSLSLPALTGECNVMPTTPTATDNCDGGSIMGTTDAIFPITTNQTITWTFTDMTGNETEQTQVVTITGDMTRPAPDEGSLLALREECMVNMPTAPPTATDICDGRITGTTTTIFPVIADATITWTFTDDAGNVTTQDQQVTISDVTEPNPNMTSLPALTGECMVNMPAAPTATDICDGSITGTTDAFPVTTTSTITWTFTDDAGNMTTQDQQVTISDETAPDPDMTSLPTLTGECSVMPATPTAMDNCDTGSITGTTTTSLPVTTTSTITWTFTDDAGNVTTQTQQVTISDATMPVPEVDPLPTLTGECSVMPAAPTAMDNCDTGSITGTTTTTFPVAADATITWTFTDMTGNETTQTQDVVIDDVTAPVPDMPSLSPLEEECSVDMATAPTATDNCDGSITGITTAIFPVAADATITWTFTDVAGNRITQDQQVTITMSDCPDIRMYPNPSQGLLYFSISNYEMISVKIYRMDGALVFSSIARDAVPLNIESLSGGSYVVRADFEGEKVFSSRLDKIK